MRFCSLIVLGRGTQQIGRRDEIPSENPFSYLEIQLTHTAVHSKAGTLRGQRNLVSVCHRVLTTVGFTYTHTHTHACTHTHTLYTHSLTTHDCPLITASFHSHPHSFSPYLLHTPVILPSFSTSPHSFTPPFFPFLPPCSSTLLPPFVTAACPLISFLTFLSHTLTYKMPQLFSRLKCLVTQSVRCIVAYLLIHSLD